MRLSLPTLIFFALSAPLAAQTVDDWRTDIGPPTNFVAADSTGHVYALDLGFTVTRLDPDGNILWARHLDVGPTNNHERAFQCVVDSTDAVIAAGYSEDTGEYMTVKWDTQGVMQWAHLYQEGLVDEALKIGIDAADNVYITGHSYNPHQFALDVMTISLGPNGNLRWSKRFDIGGSEQPTAMDVLPDGTVAVAGHAGGNTTIVVSYDTNGNELFSASRYPTNISANGVGIASDGAVYTCGMSVGFGNILCWNPDGTLEWEFEHNRPGFPIWSNYRKLDVMSNDNVVVCGQADGLGGYTDWSTVCVDRQGNLVWEDYVNGFETNDEWAESITVGADDAVYAGGKICENDFTSWMHGLVVKWDRHGKRIWEHHYADEGGGAITRGVLALDNVERVLAGTVAVTRVSDTSKLQLDSDPLVAGSPAEFVVGNANAFETVHFLYSLAGMGDGPSPGALGVLSLDLLPGIRIAGRADADLNGVATLTRTVPLNAAGRAVWLQAVVARGAGGADSLSSNVVATAVP